MPIRRPAAEALARLRQRDRFTGAEGYVFCNRLGRRLDLSAVRRRCKHAKIDAAAIVAVNVAFGVADAAAGETVAEPPNPMYRHSEYMSTTKEQRLQIRVDPQRKQLLERAADAAHQNLSAFVLGAASRHAEEVLAECAVVELSPQAAQAFSDALAQPARVNERLAAALDRPQRFRWVD